MNIYDIIIKPLITEKSISGIKNGKYMFEVNRNAEKIMIKKAIEKIFDVNVLKINVIKVHPKIKKIKTSIGKTNIRKKAIITLHKDSNKIDTFNDFL